MIRIRHNIKTIEVLKGKLLKKDLPDNLKEYAIIDLVKEKPKKATKKEKKE